MSTCLTNHFDFVSQCGSTDQCTTWSNIKITTRGVINKISFTIPIGSKCSRTFECPLDMCVFTLENDAGMNMRAFKMSSKTFTTETDVAQQINAFGTYSMRYTNLTVLFTNLDIT